MDSDNIVRHLSALWHTNRIIADLKMRHLILGLGIGAIAALVAAFGLGMLELAAYFKLGEVLSPISAAVILGLVNLAIAAVLFALARRPLQTRELELANEVHGASMEGLQFEARALQSQLSGVVRNPMHSILPALVVPLITIISKSLRRKPGAAEAAAAEAAASEAERRRASA